MFKLNNNVLKSNLEFKRIKDNNLQIEIIAEYLNDFYTISFYSTIKDEILLNFPLNEDIDMSNYLNLSDVKIGINNSYSLNGLDYGNIFFTRISDNSFKIKIKLTDYFDIETRKMYNFEIDELLVLK